MGREAIRWNCVKCGPTIFIDYGGISGLECGYCGEPMKRVRVLDQNLPRPVEEVEADWNKSLYWEDPRITAERMTKYGISVIECFTFGQFQAPTISLPENIVEGIVELNNVEEVLQRPPL